MSKRVLVTGASGFAGANLVRRLLREGHETHLLLRPPHQTWRLREIGPHVGQHHAHIENGPAVKTIVHAVRPDWVFHLAAAYHNMEEMVATNIMGTVHLLDACAHEGIEAFIHAGLKETPGAPDTGYAITKAAASRYCSCASLTHNVNAIALHFSPMYGPWQNPTQTASPAASLYIDDAVDAALQAATAGAPPRGAAFDIGFPASTLPNWTSSTDPETGSLRFREWLAQHPEIWHLYSPLSPPQ